MLSKGLEEDRSLQMCLMLEARSFKWSEEGNDGFQYSCRLAKYTLVSFKVDIQ